MCSKLYLCSEYFFFSCYPFDFFALLQAVQSRLSIIPKSRVNIQISKVEMEVDISIIDRIAAVLNPTPLYTQSFSGPKGPMYSSFLSQPLLVSINLHI